MNRAVSIFILVSFIITGQIGTFPAHAQDFVLPAPGVMIKLSPELNSPILKGLKVHPDDPFRFDFILDRGDSNQNSDQLKGEYSKLIKYFLASLTIPEKDLWVNLSPYEKDRIVPDSFGQTEMGRDLLAEDYILKQITASLIYPEDEIGKKFWRRIYEEAQAKYHTTNISVNTFNKVWIVPEKAIVYENVNAGTAYVVESKLKVMLEQDYLSLEKHETPKETNQLGSQIIREIVIPELTKEINEGKNFSQLRQVYNSLILATWYKKKIKDSVLSQVYADKNKIQGVNVDDPQEKKRIYQQYLQAFKKGAYNYIKEDQDPITNQLIPKKYFSGGANLTMTSIGPQSVFKVIDSADISNPRKNIQDELTVDLAMSSSSDSNVISSKDPHFTPIPEGGTILSFGTSTTKGVDKPEYSYPALLERMVSHKVINAGVPGERIVNEGHKFETLMDGLTRLPMLLKEHKPSLLILWEGRTDWFDEKDDAVVRQALIQMIEEAKKINCQVLLLGSIKPGQNEDPSVYQNVAEMTRVPYLKDIEKGVLGSEEYDFDGLHTNAEGNLLFAQRIAKYLSEKGALTQAPNTSLTVPPSVRFIFQKYDPPLEGHGQFVGSQGEVRFTVGFGKENIDPDKISLFLKVTYLDRGKKYSYIEAKIDKQYKDGWYSFKANLPPDVDRYIVKASCDGKPIADKAKFWVWSNINISVHREREPISFQFDPRLGVRGSIARYGPRLERLPKKSTVLMYGSSSAAGVVDPLFSPSALLEKMTGLEVINGGIPGERAIDHGVSRLPGELDRFHPSLVVLWHGRNDLFEGKPDSEIAKALNQMISEAKSRNIQVLLLGGTKRNQIDDASVYRIVAIKNNVPYLEEIMRDVLSHQEFMADDIHANAEGNVFFARYIAEFLWEAGALEHEPNLFLNPLTPRKIEFKEYDPPVYRETQVLSSNRTAYFTVGFGESVPSDQVAMRLHYQIPDDPQGRWTDSELGAEIVNDYGHGYYRFKVIIPANVKVYTVRISSDGKPFSDTDKLWSGLDWNIRVYDRAQLSESVQGGIDLTSNKFLQTQNSSEGIKFHLDSAQFQQFQNASGFTPIIINIQPMTDLRRFLGLTEQKSVPVPV